MDKQGKVIEALECCSIGDNDGNCWDCPYVAEPLCGETLKRDILALLDGQAPRLLSLDEYRDIAERPAEARVPVWLEWRDKPGRWTIPERAYTGYGTAWRCWTERPTDEQRQAVKWDECKR